LSQKLSNYHISLWRKVFFPIFNQIFLNSYQSCPMLRGVIKKQLEPGCSLGTWYLGVYQKILGTKLFIFTITKIFHFILVLLSFGPRVHFQSQTLTFWSNTPEYKFQSKTVQLSYFTLEKSFFFVFNQCFSFISKLPNVARSHQKKQKKRSLLWEHGIWRISKKN
jgi:hypothetical protein